MTSFTKYVAGAIVIAVASLGAYLLHSRPADETSSALPAAEAESSPSLADGGVLSPAVGDGEPAVPIAVEGVQRKKRSIESLLATPQGLNDSLSSITADAKRFDETLEELEQQYHSDIEARKLGNIYSEQIRAKLSESGAGVDLEKLACGVLVCAAKFKGKQLSSDEFSRLLMDTPKGDRQLYSSVIQIVPPVPGAPADTAIYRVFFSSDPQANRIIVRP